MTDVPIACTLSPDGFQARMSLIDALAVDGLLDRAPIENGVRVRLRDTPDIEQRTLALVAAESRCCAFLGFDLRRQDGELVLDIAAGRPTGDRAVLRTRAPRPSSPRSA